MEGSGLGGIRIELPEDVKNIINRLNEAGHEAFAVGGCIRDSILGRDPEDWDITTSAKPEEIKDVFERTVDTGIKHGTVTVVLKCRTSAYTERYELRPYEVTTYRIDGEYRDGRHPEQVSFTPSLREDLRRRDFTINAMAYNDEVGLVDEFSGLADIKSKVIRCVGDPDERFSEDALRILRAVRFSAQLGFDIEDGTAAAVRSHASNLRLVSKERIQAELSKLLCSGHPDSVRELWSLGMAQYVCEGFEKLDRDVFSRLEPVSGYQEIPVTHKYRRYAMLLSSLSEDKVRDMLKELRMDNDTIGKAGMLVRKLWKPIASDPYEIKLAMQDTSPELFSELIDMKELFSSDDRYKELCPAEDQQELRRIFDRIIERDEPVYMKDMIVKGSDLIKAGLRPGTEIGELLRKMQDDVLRHPEHNSILYLFSTYLYVRKT